MTGQLEALDWGMLIGYFVVIALIALWAYRQERADQTAAGYFLSGRNVGWFVVGASLFVSNIGSEHLVGLAGTAADSGVAVGQFEVIASLVLLLLGWVFVPFYVKSGVFTMPEFLERRFSPASRWYLSIVSIVAYVLTKIAVTLYAGGIVFEALMGVSFWTGALLTVAFTGVYTIMGGLRAVVYTDAMQMIVLVFGSLLVTVLGLAELGGWTGLTSAVSENYMSLWRPLSDPQFPWTGIVFGAPILGVWYWCTDQVIVQRTLAARNDDNARRGTIFAAYLKVLPLFLFVIPGVIAFALAKQGALQLEQADQALPSLVRFVLPVGIRGLVVAGLLAALMSSLSSVFNSTSTLVTWDIYRELRPQASERQLVWVGRIATAAMTGFGLAAIPIIDNISSTLYVYLQSVQGYIAPPIAAVFLLGIAWHRVNAQGAITSLLAGAVMGLTRFILELMNGLNQDGLPAGTVWETVAEWNFLHVAAGLFVICVAILVGVSLVTPPPPRERLAGLTYSTAEEPVVAGTAGAGGTTGTEEGAAKTETESPQLTERPGWRRADVLLSIGVLALVCIVWLYFS
ncbi:MAG: sodium:solute symporter [Actinobacteria bacterium]|nr:sodium:solute symporter [Actinomycetota bacterium]